FGLLPAREIAWTRVGEVSAAARSPAPGLELVEIRAADHRGDAGPLSGHVGLGVAPASLVHQPAELIAVTGLNLGQFSGLDRVGRGHSPAPASGSASSSASGTRSSGESRKHTG